MATIGLVALAVSSGIWLTDGYTQVTLAKLGVPTPPLLSRVFPIDRERIKYFPDVTEQSEPREHLQTAVNGYESDALEFPGRDSSTVRPVSVGVSLDRLEIPRIGLNVAVQLLAPDTVPEQPIAGWMFGSGLPGLPGNLVILGHLDGNSAIFGRLSELEVNDEVRVSAGGQLYVYIVTEEQTVPKSAVEVLNPTATAQMTLLTCTGSWDSAAGTYDQRLIVRADYVATGWIGD